MRKSSEKMFRKKKINKEKVEIKGNFRNMCNGHPDHYKEEFEKNSSFFINKSNYLLKKAILKRGYPKIGRLVSLISFRAVTIIFCILLQFFPQAN